MDVTVNLKAFRLGPGTDLREGYERQVGEMGIEAGAIVTCVGSLTAATLRMADESVTRSLRGPFEIVSLVGTLSTNGCHCHMSVSDGAGRVVGGHVAYGCTIFTTAEIVVAILQDTVFERIEDAETGFRELAVGMTDANE